MTPALLLSALLASTTTLEFRLLPPGHDGVVEGVGRARYFLLDEYLKLAEFDSELYTLRKNYDMALQVGKTMRSGLDAGVRESAACMKELDILSRRSGRLMQKWDECEKSLQECNGSAWPYIVAAVGSILTVVGATLIVVSN
jgi:hypothetical protein